jgi:hypothetical protein
MKLLDLNITGGADSDSVDDLLRAIQPDFRLPSPLLKLAVDPETRELVEHCYNACGSQMWRCRQADATAEREKWFKAARQLAVILGSTRRRYEDNIRRAQQRAA